MKTLRPIFVAWLVGACGSAVLRFVAGWPGWRVAEVAAIAVLSAALLPLAARTPARGRPEWEMVNRLMLGWIIINATGAVLSGYVAAGVDAVLFLPALVVMLRITRRPARVGAVASQR